MPGWTDAGIQADRAAGWDIYDLLDWVEDRQRRRVHSKMMQGTLPTRSYCGGRITRKGLRPMIASLLRRHGPMSLKQIVSILPLCSEGTVRGALIDGTGISWTRSLTGFTHGGGPSHYIYRIKAASRGTE